MRDKVMGAANNSSSDDEEDKENLAENVDLTYYNMMTADEKLMTLRNRALKLQEKQQAIMKTVQDCENLYPIGMGWQDNVHLASPSDDENMS